MSHITLTPAKGRWTAMAGDQIIADTTAALELREGDSGPVIYIPRVAARMDLLTRTERQSFCPHKGKASYYSAPGLPNAIWTYEDPKDPVTDIAGHLAFYTDRISLSRG